MNSATTKLLPIFNNFRGFLLQTLFDYPTDVRGRTKKYARSRSKHKQHFLFERENRQPVYRNEEREGREKESRKGWKEK